jgi:hypothetical protein
MFDDFQAYLHNATPTEVSFYERIRTMLTAEWFGVRGTRVLLDQITPRTGTVQVIHCANYLEKCNVLPKCVDPDGFISVLYGSDASPTDRMHGSASSAYNSTAGVAGPGAVYGARFFGD